MQITDEQLIAELQRRFASNKKQVKELSELTQELLLVNQKLADSEAMKTNFISNITNEIVNPFASIIGLARNISEAKGSNWEIVDRMAKLIFKEAICLNFQLKNIFTAAEIESGNLSPVFSKTDIVSIFENSLESFESQISDKKLKITVNSPSPDEPKTFFATDADKLSLIFNNLISNAINYSSENQEIICSIEIKDNILHFNVHDFGIGINERDHQIIFDRFKRLDTSINSINRGHGLGLSIVKSLMEMINGEIELESSENIGTSIYFGNDEIF